MSAPKAAAHAAKPAAGAAPATEEKAKPAGASKLLIGVFVSAIIIAETGVFFLMVPSGEEVALLAETRLIESVRKQANDSKAEEASTPGGHGGAKTAEKNGDENVEFDFGTFPVAFVPIGDTRNHRVEFQLFGELKQKDKAHLEELAKERTLRLRSKIMLEVRNCTLQDLTENQLGLIKRRLLRTINDLLGEELLISVNFADYQVIEE